MNTFSSPARREVTQAMADEALRATSARSSPKTDEPPFRAGDAVVYAAHGVGRVEHVGAELVAGHPIDLIRVSFPANRMVLRIPTAKAREAGLRPLSSRAALDDALRVLAGRPRSGAKLWARRAVDIQNRINTGDLASVATVARDLRHHAVDDKGSFSERQLFEAALGRVATEIAAITGDDEATVTADLLVRLRDAAASDRRRTGGKDDDASADDAPADDET